MERARNGGPSNTTQRPEATGAALDCKRRRAHGMHVVQFGGEGVWSGAMERFGLGDMSKGDHVAIEPLLHDRRVVRRVRKKVGLQVLEERTGLWSWGVAHNQRSVWHTNGRHTATIASWVRVCCAGGSGLQSGGVASVGGGKIDVSHHLEVVSSALEAQADDGHLTTCRPVELEQRQWVCQDCTRVCGTALQLKTALRQRSHSAGLSR
jgi:hypothetical protein